MAFALLIALAAIVAGCGSSSGGSSSSTESTESASSETTASESSGGGSEGQEAAQEFVAENSNLEKLEFPEPPDEPYDPGTGKIGIVICSTLGSGCVEMGKEAVKAAKAAGWEPTEPLNGEFSPNVQSGLIQKLVAEKVDAIELISIQPETVANAIHAAIEAGIPISDVYAAGDKVFPKWGGPLVQVTSDGVEQGEFAGTYIAANANSEGKTRVDVVGNDPAFAILLERTKGIENALGKYCPECELHITHLSGEELAKPGPPAFSALLSSNPPGSLEWVLGGPTDPFGQLMLKTAEQRGREDIKMVGLDTAPEVIENIKAGGLTQADIYSSFRYAAWAGVEQVIRQKAGLKPWKAYDLPPAYVTAENVAGPVSQLPLSYAPPSFDYEALFKQLWGK